MSELKELAAYRLERAKTTLEEARMMAASGHWNTCINRLYYACFYAVNALLITQGLSSSKHSGVRAFFNLHYVKTKLVPKDEASLFNDLFEYRRDSDYADYYQADSELAKSFIDRTDDFLEVINTLIVKFFSNSEQLHGGK